MKAPLIQKRFSDATGLSVVELMIVVAMIAVISGFLLVNLVQGHRTVARTKTATEIANFLQKARLDSMRRHVTDINQMAQMKVFNRRFYSIAVDADGDGNLDIPLVVTLPAEQDVEISGPFPKTFIFNSLGLTVDAQGRRIAAEPVIVSNSSGASAITFPEGGNITIVAAVKPTAAD